VVDVYDYVEEPDRVWIAEQWVNGAALDAILTANGPLTSEQSLGVMRGALMGLAHAHERGLVHRDVAPSNILADLEGASMLVDFGVAAPVGGTDIQGTPAFMSPEAAAGTAVTKSSDVYSAGAVLFTLLSGRPPFEATDPVSMMRRHREDAPPPLTGQGAELQDLVGRALAKDPAARPPDAAAFLVELEDAAKRRFGDAWLTRASITGVVATTVAGAGAAAGGLLTGTGAAAGAHAAQTVIVDVGAAGAEGVSAATHAVEPALQSAGHAAAKAGRKGRLGGLSTPVIAGITAVVLVAVVAVGAVAMKGSSDKDTAAGASTSSVPSGAAVSTAPSSSLSASPTPTPTLDLAVLAPGGKYTLKYKVLSSTYTGEKAGQTGTSVVTLTSKCFVKTCTGRLVGSTGKGLTYVWDGTVLLLKGRTKATTDTCIDTVTGRKVPGSHALATQTEQFSPLVAKRVAGAVVGPPDVLRGTEEITTRISKRFNCSKGGSFFKGRYALTYTRGVAPSPASSASGASPSVSSTASKSPSTP
jgi:serine/threonine-protein kinase